MEMEISHYLVLGGTDGYRGNIRHDILMHSMHFIVGMIGDDGSIVIV